MRITAPRGTSALEKVEYCSRVDVSGCHLWIAARDKWGYGKTYWDGRLWMAHRLAWFANFGAIPAGMLVLHRCDIPACVNPDHLWLGTNADNMADMKRKGRARNGVMAGTWRMPKGPQHWQKPKLTPEQVEAVRVSRQTYKRIGAEYSISDATIWKIKKGKR